MAEQNEQLIKQNPAVIIGLGGTGKEILLNFRRLLLERYGNMRLPHVGNLWIDTDPRNITLDGKEMDFIMKEVDFDGKEIVPVELSNSDLKNYYDHKENYPQIFSWFDKRLEEQGSVTHGAGGIRCFGRLAFFRHYPEIMKAVRDKRTNLLKVDKSSNNNSDNKIQIDATNMEFWLVFSVAGGTGGGMFLDMAFSLREAWPNAKIRAVVLLPSIFSNDFTHKYFGNAYAALMELEYYNYGKNEAEAAGNHKINRFDLAWTKSKYLENKSVSGPVFDNTYIIGNQPDSSAGVITLDEKDALCRMIAESFFVEYGYGPDVESLGAQRRSAQSNFAEDLRGKITHNYGYNDFTFSEVFSCRYSSFGLSKLHIPIHRIETLVHNRLAFDIATYWSRERNIPASLDERLDKEYLHQVGINNKPKHKDMLRALESGNDGERLIQRLQKMIWDEKRAQFIGMSDRQDVRSRINDWVDDEILSDQLDCTNIVEDRWGAISKEIRRNGDDAYQNIVKRLDELVQMLLAQPNYRFESTREILRRMRDRLLKDVENFERLAEKNREASNQAGKEAQIRLQWLDEVKHGFSRRIIIDVALENLESRITRELQAQILKTAAGLAERIVEHIGRGRTDHNAEGEEVIVETGLLKQVIDFQKLLRANLAPRLNERVTALNKTNRSPIYLDLSDGSNEIDRFYVDSNNQPITETTLRDWETRFFEEQGPIGPHSLWELRLTLANQGTDAIIKRLVDFALTTTYYLREKTINVLDRLTEKYKPGSAEYLRLMEDLVNYGQPWLAKPEHFVDRENAWSNLNQARWIALNERGNSESTRIFKSDLEKKSPNRFSIVSTSPDRVYALSEVAGFPLMVIPDLNKYRDEAYFKALLENKVLHTDLAFEKFQDLLLKEPKEVEKFLQALTSFLKAISLGVIKTEQNRTRVQGDVLTFSLIAKTGLFENIVALGPFSMALQRLINDRDYNLLDTIDEQILEITRAMDDKSLARWIALLSFHANKDDSYFGHYSKRHVIRVAFRQETEKLLQNNDVLETIAKEELPNIKHWALERPEKSGLFVLSDAS